MPPQHPQGSVLVLSLVFIAIFAALAVALHSVAGSSVQLADNYRRADTTRCSAESGLEVMRYWLSQVVLTAIDVNNIELGITGRYGSLDRKVTSGFVLAQRADNVFDFGIATKGPLSLTGNVEFDGYTIAVECNAYIDCDTQPALSVVGNCDIGGIVDGSVINYSDAPLEMSGNSDLQFNRTTRKKMPAGFMSRTVLQYDASSYSEAAL